MKKYLNIVVLFVCLMSGAVHAEKAKIYSFTDSSCGDWAASAQEHPAKRQVFVEWVRGFVSGYNWTAPGNQAYIEGHLSSETVSLYLDKYCRENPLKLWEDGTFELIYELRGDKN